MSPFFIELSVFQYPFFYFLRNFPNQKHLQPYWNQQNFISIISQHRFILSLPFSLLFPLFQCFHLFPIFTFSYERNFVANRLWIYVAFCLFMNFDFHYCIYTFSYFYLLIINRLSGYVPIFLRIFFNAPDLRKLIHHHLFKI